jgi:nitroreductase
MPSHVLDLTSDELLSTTRAVRMRLDLTRPVERELLEECLSLAQQAPNGSNRQPWHFVVVTDADQRAALAQLWRLRGKRYLDTQRPATQTGAAARLYAAVVHLYEHLHEVPVHVIPCLSGRTDGAPIEAQAGAFGSIIPAVWSFMLAARARSLGSVYTTFHLEHERDAADVLGIPYEEIMQVALIPVAHTIGTEFKRGPRLPLESIVHWDRWSPA